MANNYTRKILETFDRGFEVGERVTRQLLIDCFQIALGRYEKLNLGYQRIMEITDIAEQVRQEYERAFTKDPEADVYRDRLDRELLAIIQDNAPLITFYKRYPEVREITYHGRKK